MNFSNLIGNMMNIQYSKQQRISRFGSCVNRGDRLCGEDADGGGVVLRGVSGVWEWENVLGTDELVGSIIE